jgi:hypothetical protein
MAKQEVRKDGQAWPEDLRTPSKLTPASWINILFAAFFVAIPPILFYTVLFRKALNLPIGDDYHATLDFTNHLILLKGASAKCLYFLAAQHNEYKLFFLHGLAWMQFCLFGHIDFRVLSAIANGFVFLLAILLWKMFLPNHKDLAARLAFFIPVPWLLFQLQHWENLNWAADGLQHIPLLPFALGAIYLLVRGERWAFGAALGCLVLAVAADGNGLLMIPIGLLILVRARNYARVLGWLAASAVCVAAYAFRFDFMSSQIEAHRSVLSTFHPLSPAYILAFIGSAGSIFRGSIVLGIILCCFFVFMAFRGYTRKNPAVSYCVLFLLLTAIGVAGLRSDLGVVQGLSSRYAIYSALLLIFAWFAIVEEFLQHRRLTPLHNNVLLGVTIAVILFSLFMDWLGSAMLDDRNRGLVKAMAAYEHPASPESTNGPTPWFQSLTLGTPSDAFNLRARATLDQSTEHGVYRPPDYSSVDAQ